MIRAGYGARAVYTRMAVRALALWRAHDARYGRRLFRHTGALWLTLPKRGARAARDRPGFARDTFATLQAEGVAVRSLTPSEAARTYPALDFSGHHQRAARARRRLPPRPPRVRARRRVPDRGGRRVPSGRSGVAGALVEIDAAARRRRDDRRRRLRLRLRAVDGHAVPGDHRQARDLHATGGLLLRHARPAIDAFTTTRCRCGSSWVRR